MPADFVLTLSCADRPGIVAAVTTELAALNANIAESNQFWDKETGTVLHAARLHARPTAPTATPSSARCGPPSSASACARRWSTRAARSASS